jgi:hypothetical protein
MVDVPDPRRGGPRHQIGVLVFDGVEELDAVGPWEVLSHWTQEHPEDGWDAFCLSPDGASVLGAKTLALGAHHSIQDAPDLDVLIHPGGPGTRPMLHDRAHLDWVRQQRSAVPLMTSPSSTKRSSGRTSMVGSISLSTSSERQWVVAGRLASKPAAANTSEPVQTLVNSGTSLCWRRTQSSCSLSCSCGRVPCPPG